MVAIQFISLGFLALQSKNYFEELFHLGSTLFSNVKEIEEGSEFGKPDRD